MKNIQKVAVLGGNGRTGNHLVRQLLEKGFDLKVLLRNPENFSIQNPKIEIVKGDALEMNCIRDLLKDCDVAISTLGQRQNEPLTALKATGNILKVMKEYAIKRYILLAGLNVDTPFDKKSDITISATNYMKTNFPEIQEDRQKAYDALVESNIDWTLVRVPFIDFNVPSSKILISLEDCLGERIAATAITRFMIKVLEESIFIKQAPFIAGE
ncbi:NAD(P)-dependent oxidoreductase [Flavobacterium hungaricum]|uniref:NAD-dependent epimerase/dehydratase family protein n=1 Tax=Flavobacterium hungaricum TaxID=2082725 RepID=A0ABR9TRP4_9FLAO|nr:NAD(P)H-binding protein [Flavobacterium hungaricum]MBE8727449.1 NAD-dependent epimerase/dehydratase family protein [Flavobacterium hungaricum]